MSLDPRKGLIPLMAVLQENKQKVCPVMDYCKLNEHGDMYMASTDVFVQKLREWQQPGTKAAVPDLHQAYLQVHMKRSQWSFQRVEIRGQRYCLTHLGFRLKITPLIIWSIVNAVMKQDKIVNTATSSYINNIFVNESMCSTARIKEHLEQFSLTRNILEQLRHDTCMLGFWEEQGKLQWCCRSELPIVASVLTHCVIFSV